MAQSPFDPSRYRWRNVVGDPGLSYKVHHDYTVLGHDRAAGTLDMLVRWYGDGGHCPIHRHVATTTVLVLDGEQHLLDVYPDGSRGNPRVRRAGEYALSTATRTRTSSAAVRTAASRSSAATRTTACSTNWATRAARCS
jgi:hypothetical protein